MSTKVSIIWNDSLDYYFHIYCDQIDGKYYFELENFKIRISKKVLNKLKRDLKKGDIKFT